MLGKGAFGVVWEATSVNSKEKFAIKMVHKDKVVIIMMIALLFNFLIAWECLHTASREGNTSTQSR